MHVSVSVCLSVCVRFKMFPTLSGSLVVNGHGSLRHAHGPRMMPLQVELEVQTERGSVRAKGSVVYVCVFAGLVLTPLMIVK